MTTFGTRTDLEQRFGAQRLLQMFDDDGDGVVASADLTTLQAVMAEADDIVAGILIGKGWTEAQLEELKADKQITRAWAGIVMQLAGERKPEWGDAEGFGPYDGIGQRARAELDKLATGKIRSVAEDTAGTNLGLVGDYERREFIFAPDPRNPNDRGPGGF